MVPQGVVWNGRKPVGFGAVRIGRASTGMVVFGMDCMGMVGNGPSGRFGGLSLCAVWLGQACSGMVSSGVQ